MNAIYKKLKTPRSLTILGLIVALVAPVAIATPSASAEAENQSVSYMTMYSAKGTYTKAKITMVTLPAQSKHCGGTLNNSGSNNYVIVKLYKTRPHKILCDAVGPGSEYQITFLKGKKSTNNLADYQQLPNSGSDLFNAVDVDANTTIKPFKSCMVIVPTVGKTNLPTSNCPTSSALDVLPLDKDNSQLSININPSTNASVVSAPKGRVILTDTGAWDGNTYVSRPFCTGKIDFYYQPSGQATWTGPYKKSMKFVNGQCEAKLVSDRYKISKKTTYNVKAVFAGNAYFDAPADATATFSTR